MLISTKCRSTSKLGYVGPKLRSLNQILKYPCVHSRGHNLKKKSMKLCQNVNSHKSKSSSKLGHVGLKTRSLGQIMKKPCVHSRGCSFDQKFIKLFQHVNSYKI